MSEKDIHAGHRQRLRERFRTQGLSGFAEHEALELLLTYAIPHKDVNPTAHALLNRFGTLAAVLEADAGELMRVPGVGENAATLIALMPELFGRYQRSLLGERPVITTFREAVSYCLSLFYGAREEEIYLICLDQGGRVLHPALLRRGTIDSVTLYPREVVELALRHRAHAVLLAHNHPSGHAHASQADQSVTQMIAQALSVVGVRLVDHLVISGQSACSVTRGTRGGAEEIEYRRREQYAAASDGRLREAPDKDGDEVYPLLGELDGPEE